MYSEGSDQSVSLHSETFLKTGEDSWLINDSNLDFMMDEIVWQDQIVFGLSVCQKIQDINRIFRCD